MQPQKKQESLSKIQVEQRFDKLFQNEANTVCFQCGKKTKQWAQVKYAIILCLDCGTIYQQILKVEVKSTSLSEWTQRQFRILKAGGNARFKKFLQNYNFQDNNPKVVMRSKAAEYYRRKLISDVDNQPIQPAPPIQQGKKPFVSDIPLTEMTTDQMLQQAKQKLTWVGGKTKQLGSKAYDKVHHKITSGQLKQDAKKVGESISTTAKSIFAFISTKVDSLKTKAQVTKEASSL